MDISLFFCYTDSKHLGKEKNMKKNAFGRLHADWLVLFMGATLLALYLGIELLLLLVPQLRMQTLERALILVLVCFVLYLGAHLHTHRTNSPLMMRRLTVVIFVLYLYFLISVTLLDKSLGRTPTATHLINFIPFHSIHQTDIVGYYNGLLNLYHVLMNLVGNLIAFVPFAILTPILFKAEQKWYIFLPTTVLTVCVIEALQFVLWVGCADVDDLILNTMGAMIAYDILRIPFVKRLVNHLLFEERLQ